MEPNRNRQFGFSLIEILVAVTIIALLSATLTLGFAKQQTLARDTRRITDVSTISIAVEGYRNAHGSYPPPAATLVTVDAAAGVGPILVNEGLLNNIPKDPKPGLLSGGPTGTSICTNYVYTKNYDFTSFDAAGIKYQNLPLKTRQWGIAFGTERGASDNNNTYLGQSGVFTTQTVYAGAGGSSCQSDRYFSAVMGNLVPTP